MAINNTMTNTTTKTFRPLLSAAIVDATSQTLRFPLIASPKIDGIRIVCHPELGPVTRSLKPVRNKYVRSLLSNPLFSGLDGEVVVGPMAAKDVFQRTTTGIMTQDGTPEFLYYVFDDITHPEVPYNLRLYDVEMRCQQLPTSEASYVYDLDWIPLTNANQILDAEVQWLSKGFEGVMLRDPEAPYKYGRSTVKEQTLIKLKRFADDEATIVGFEPLLHNANPQTRDLLGLAERSDHKSGKVAQETLGNLLVSHNTFGDFAIGSGFDASLRQHIWTNKEDYLGKQVCFKYQVVGVKDKPRFPIWKGLREDK